MTNVLFSRGLRFLLPVFSLCALARCDLATLTLKNKSSAGAGRCLQSTSSALYASDGQASVIHLPQAVQAHPQINGSGVKAAVIDAGFESTSPALKNKIGTTHVDCTLNPCKVVASLSGGNQHGTAVAGVMAGDASDYRGIAPKATLFLVKASAPNFSPDKASFARAIQWIIDYNKPLQQKDRIQVVNMSLGDAGNSSLTQAMYNQGVVNVFAAGNFANTWNSPLPYGWITGAITYTEPVTVMKENFGGTNYESAKGPGLSLYAPGSSGMTLMYPNPIKGGPGTSWAAPQAAGTAILLRQINRAFTQNDILSMIRGDRKITDQLGYPHPVLDVQLALTRACASTNAAVCGAPAGGDATGGGANPNTTPPVRMPPVTTPPAMTDDEEDPNPTVDTDPEVSEPEPDC